MKAPRPKTNSLLALHIACQDYELAVTALRGIQVELSKRTDLNCDKPLTEAERQAHGWMGESCRHGQYFNTSSPSGNPEGESYYLTIRSQDEWCSNCLSLHLVLQRRRAWRRRRGEALTRIVNTTRAAQTKQQLVYTLPADRPRKHSKKQATPWQI